MSITVPECYKSIVGLTRTDCECYSDMPDSAADSLSGLYLDELVGLSFIQSMTNCDNGDDLFLNMEKARDNAITSFQADTNALLLQNFKMRRTPFQGGIGRVVGNKVPLVDGNYHSVWMYCDSVRGGVLHIKSIGALFLGTGTVELTIYNNLGDEISTHTLNTVANSHTQNPVDIQLPMHSDYVENVAYCFQYKYDDSLVPKVNDIKCNCGSFKPRFDCNKPYFHSRHESTYRWADWLMIGGVSSPEPPELTGYMGSISNYLYGLTFQVELKCKIGEVLCTDQLDFEGNPLAAAMAIAIQNKAGEVLGNWVLQSGNLNRFTLINTDQFITDVANYRATYEQMIQYIVESADITQNDCFACKDVWGMAKKGIFS